MESQPVVKLDELNDKLRAKEFKNTVKELKSKDDAVKISAIIKVGKELRYFSEGGCAPALLISLVPKKKTYQYLVDAFPLITNLFMELKLTNPVENPFFLGLESAFNTEIEASLFTGLIECLCLKEIVKKKKPSKNAPPEPDPPESQQVLAIRQLSIKALFYFIHSLLPYGVNSSITAKLRSLSALISAVCANLVFNIEYLESSDLKNEDKPQYTQNLIYGLQILSFLVRDNSSGATVAASTNFVSKFSFLLENKHLVIYSLQIFRSLCTVDLGIEVCAVESNINLILTLADAVVQKVKELTVVVDPVPAKGGKDPKKDDKNKKGQPVQQEETDPLDLLDFVKLDPKRECVVWFTLYSAAFIDIVKQKPANINSEQIDKILSIFKGYILNETVWEVARSPHSAPVDEPVNRIMEYSFWFIGSLAEFSFENRYKMCNDGAIQASLTLLLNSQKVFAGGEDRGAELLTLRKFAEKAILALMLPATSTPVPDNLDPQAYRWFSNYQYSITMDNLTSFGTSFFTLLSDIISGTEDSDLCSRGSRILFTVLMSLRMLNSFEALTQTQIDKQFVSKLSVYLSTLGNKLSTNEQDAGLNLFSSSHSLDPSIAEGFYFSLSAIELLLDLQVDHIKTFAEKPRLEMLSKLLDIYGPVAHKLSVSELQIQLNDPRDYDWFLFIRPSIIPEQQLLRPLIIDNLRQVISSDQKYRVFEGTIPAEPGKPLPASSCPCEEMVLNSVKICSDGILKILLQSADWISDSTQNILKLSVSRQSALNQLVRDSSLQYLEAVGKCGPIGVAALLESVSSRSFNESYENSSLGQLIKVVSPPEENSFNPATVVFKRPLFFDEVFSPSTDSKSLRFAKIDILQKNPNLWPFCSIAAAILSVMMDPLSHSKSAKLSIDAAKSLMLVPHFQLMSQPVLIDILVATFLNLGGGFALISSLGSFGHIHQSEKDAFIEFASYVFSRGQNREAFWTDYYEKNKEPVQIDPKTGKPIPKKEDKNAKKEKEVKKDPKAPIVIPVVAEIVYNYESTEEFNDPNHGPTLTQWKELLDFQSNDLYLYRNISSLLIHSVQSSLVDLALHLMQQKIDINLQDDCGCTALMYAFLFEQQPVVEELLKHADYLDINKVDFQGNPTIYYALSSIASNINGINLKLYTDHFNNYGSVGVKDYQSTKCYGKALFLPLLLDASRSYSKEYQLDLKIVNSQGVSPLLFSLGIGNLPVNIGGNCFVIQNEAYYSNEYISSSYVEDSTQQYLPLKGDACENFRLLVESGADINQCTPQGLVPIHVAACYGDLPLIQYLGQRGVVFNAVDMLGRHSLHYLFANCPANVEEVFNYLLQKSANKPVHRCNYSAPDNPHATTSDNSSSILEKYHQKQQSLLAKSLNETLTIKTNPSHLLDQKRYKSLEFLLFCKDFQNQMIPLYYCFLHETLFMNDLAITEIIQFNNNYQNYNKHKFHRIRFILYVLNVIKNEKTLPLMVSSLMEMLGSAENGNQSPSSPNVSRNVSTYQSLQKFISMNINDNNDISNTINSYNIQNNLNLLFLSLAWNLPLFESEEDHPGFSQPPLFNYNICAGTGGFNISSVYYLNICHALSLLFWKGERIDRKTISEKEKVFQRNIHYESVEHQLMDIMGKLITIHGDFFSNGRLNNSLLSIFFEDSNFFLREFAGKPWTPVHAAINANNLDFLTFLFQKSPSLAAEYETAGAIWSSDQQVPSPKKAKVKGTEKNIEISRNILKEKERERDNYWQKFQLLHYIANLPTPVDYSICAFIVQTYLKDSGASSSSTESVRNLLNEPSSTPYDLDAAYDANNSRVSYLPLHAAVLSRQFGLLKALSECHKVDMNRKDPKNGLTALHYIVMFLLDDYNYNTEELISSFFSALHAARDRLDLTILSKCPTNRVPFFQFLNYNPHEVEDDSQLIPMKFMNVVEYTIAKRNVKVLKELISLRRNDVIEIVLNKPSNNNNSNSSSTVGSLLFQLEEENYQLLSQLQLIKKDNPWTETERQIILEEEGLAKEDALDQVQEEDQAVEQEDKEHEQAEDEDEAAIRASLARSGEGEVLFLEQQPDEVANPAETQLDAVQREQLSLQLQQSNDILRVLLDLIRPLDMLDHSSLHFDLLYADGDLIDPAN